MISDRIERELIVLLIGTAFSALLFAVGVFQWRCRHFCSASNCRAPFAWRRRTTDDGHKRAFCKRCAMHIDRMRRARERMRQAARP